MGLVPGRESWLTEGMPVTRLLYETGGMFDPGLEERGGVDDADVADPIGPTDGGGVALGEGLPRCPGKPGVGFIAKTGLFGLFEWRADDGWIT